MIFHKNRHQKFIWLDKIRNKKILVDDDDRIGTKEKKGEEINGTMIKS